MKPELVMQDPGAHARNLAATRSRLVHGGSWKRQRIVVIMPAADRIAAKIVLSWLNLAFPPNNGVARILALGQEVGEAYSSAIEGILGHPELSGWEYILTVEHDNYPPPDGVLRLVAQMEAHPELDAIGGLYFTKGPGGVAQIWGDVRDPVLNFRPQPPDAQGGLVECYGTGMGFTLFRLSMFKDKKLRRPWFATKDGFSQDLFFWHNARAFGHRSAIDCAVKVGHYDLDGSFGPADMMW